ncbi:MAG: hypothetical protein O7H41_21525 [Planctomycetota bacterium]|nr:hypothetical protein [Planctomycetota bacterium]
MTRTKSIQDASGKGEERKTPPPWRNLHPSDRFGRPLRKREGSSPSIEDVVRMPD